MITFRYPPGRNSPRRRSEIRSASRRPSSDVARTFQGRTRASATAEARRAPGRERGRAFARVLGPDEDALREQLDLLERLLVEAVTEVDELLGEPDRERGVGRDRPCQLRGRAEVLARRDDLGDETE